MSQEDDKMRIGCCGANCGTCPALGEEPGLCRGCKLGYGKGGRDISRARCRIKVCCFGENGLTTCADCLDYENCGTIQDLFAKKGYKYGKYHESIEFIRERGYTEFLEAARAWKAAYGKLPRTKDEGGDV